MAIRNPRRHALLKSYAAMANGNPELAGVWRSKQEDRPGVLLPASFPHYTRLAAARYLAREDLVGAEARELQMNAGLSRREANAVLAALSNL